MATDEKINRLRSALIDFEKWRLVEDAMLREKCSLSHAIQERHEAMNKIMRAADKVAGFPTLRI